MTFFNPRSVQASVAKSLDLRFYEVFTGDGSTNTYQLTNNIGNATFTAGGWTAVNISNLSPGEIVRNDTLKPTYASLFYINKISVVSISSSGLVTLSAPPRAGVTFRIYYWYSTSISDIIDDYFFDEISGASEADEAKLINPDWIFVRDDQYTSVNPLVIASGVTAVLPNNRGAGSISTYGNGDWYDPATSQYQGALEVGEKWEIRLNISFRPSQGDRVVDVALNAGALNLTSNRYRLPKTAGDIAKETFNLPYAVGSTVLLNPPKIAVTPNTTLDIFGMSSYIRKVK